MHPIVPNSVWAIGTELRTGEDFGNKLGFGPDGGSDATAVILRIGEYNGFAQRSLWEKLSEWGEL